jgi:vitamin B12 transporter
MFPCLAKAQYLISGKVGTINNDPLDGVSITIKNSYDGTTSGKDGLYSFQVPAPGTITLVFSLTGYKSLEKLVSVSTSDLRLDIILKEEITEYKAVVVTAGTFEASDKKRNTVLKTLDIVTTAGQQADIIAAVKTLPGAQQVGEQEGLFVRGGTGEETKVFIDGMMVTNPFYSSVPGIAQRSRFSPLLFKGTLFSSGGYSAQFGQGLSSALILGSIDLPSRSEVNLILSSVQQSFMGQKLNKAKNGSIGLNVNYTNLGPYYSIVRQKYHFDQPPRGINAEFTLRRKLKGGVFKLYGYSNTNSIGYCRQSLEDTSFQNRFSMKNKNVLVNATLSTRLSKTWLFNSGASFSYNADDIRVRTMAVEIPISAFTPRLENQTSQARVVFTKTLPGLTRIYAGAEYQNVLDRIEARDSITRRSVIDNYVGGFIESDIYYSANLVSKAGLRYEYSSLLNKKVLSPRISIAYKLNTKSQFSFAYGIFHQKPEANFLLRKSSLDFTSATHYILNFQRTYNGQTLRIEGYNKVYKNLLTTKVIDPFAIDNNGSGYARGLEIFWRDKTTLKNLDYWFSYSYLDTKRKYLAYPNSVQPSFAATHTFNLVAKSWVNILSAMLSATYSYASGRPYENPNNTGKDFMSDRTISYHSLGLQVNYLRTFEKVNAVFIVNLSNAFGWNQVFSYRYSSRMNAAGRYTSDAITPMAKRFLFIGAYLSIGSDRRKEILD